MSLRIDGSVVQLGQFQEGHATGDTTVAAEGVVVEGPIDRYVRPAPKLDLTGALAKNGAKDKSKEFGGRERVMRDFVAHDFGSVRVPSRGEARTSDRASSGGSKGLGGKATGDRVRSFERPVREHTVERPVPVRERAVERTFGTGRETQQDGSRGGSPRESARVLERTMGRVFSPGPSRPDECGRGGMCIPDGDLPASPSSPQNPFPRTGPDPRVARSGDARESANSRGTSGGLGRAMGQIFGGRSSQARKSGDIPDIPFPTGPFPQKPDPCKHPWGCGPDPVIVKSDGARDSGSSGRTQGSFGRTMGEVFGGRSSSHPLSFGGPRNPGVAFVDPKDDGGAGGGNSDGGESGGGAGGCSGPLPDQIYIEVNGGFVTVGGTWDIDKGKSK